MSDRDLDDRALGAGPPAAPAAERQDYHGGSGCGLR